MRRVKLILGLLLGVPLAGALAFGAALLYYGWDLPQMRNLADYQPKVTSLVYSDDGRVLARFFNERRTEVPLAQLPPYVVKAFLAAEDAGFYEHEGLDYLAILRAMVKNLYSSHKQGASTITQQTVKTMVVGPERSYRRKIKEALLSKRLEDMLSKDDILHLYLNQIYFGNGVYGVEEASQLYFGHAVRDATLGEAALLAGMPKHPERYNPLDDPEGALQRRAWILGQMESRGWISASERQRAEAERCAQTREHRGLTLPYTPWWQVDERSGGYYAEQIRRDLEGRFGTQLLLEGGLTIYAVVDAGLQRAAEGALRTGLEDVDRRQGWRGPLWRIEVDQYQRAMTDLHAALDRALAGWQLHYAPPPLKAGKPVWDLSGLSAKDLAGKLRVTLRPLVVGERYAGVVTTVDPHANLARVDLGTVSGTLAYKDLQWAASQAAAQPGQGRVTSVLARGDVVLVRVLRHDFVRHEARFEEQDAFAPPPVFASRDQERLDLELVQEPKVSGALVAIEPQRGWVRALVGGYDRLGRGFNRALQARRQPGSAFKPIIYATAIAERVITAADMCPDTFVVIRDQWTGKDWRPENYDGDYDGDLRYRVALAQSKNTCSVRLVDRVGPDKVIAMARALGITAELPSNLTLALGTGEVSPLELATAYATLAAGGRRPAPVMVRKVADRSGARLLEQAPSAEQAVPPGVAYVITSMMQSVVEDGTAGRARALGRPVAGKTGTTNASRSAWFGGFTPDLAAVVYTGYDDNASMGRETGGRAALPIWVDFMQVAVADQPVRDFDAASDVVFAAIDPATGKLATPETAAPLQEAFLAGTEPTQSAGSGSGYLYSDDD